MDSLYLKKALKKWKTENELTMSEARVLVETYRRTWEFHKGRYSDKQLLLALPSDVKTIKRFFNPYSIEIPRVYNWYGLSEEGQELIKTLEKILPWDENMNHILFNF